MNVFQAIQICNDIKRLYKNKGKTEFVSWNYSNWYQIRVRDAGTIIESHRRDKSLSATEFVPCTFWTNLIGTAGYHATIPLEFTVTFNNNGLLPHAPMEKDTKINGFAARLIYNRMRNEYLKDWHATLRRIHGEEK